MPGPIVFVCNLLTEGLGMRGFTAADAVGWVERTIDRPVDLVVFNTAKPSPETLGSYASEHKEPLALGDAAAAPGAGRGGRCGPATSPATIAAGCRTRSGACSAATSCPDAASAAGATATCRGR